MPASMPEVVRDDGQEDDMVLSMDTAELIDSLMVVSENIEQLLVALTDLGFEGLSILKIEGGYGLYSGNVMLAAGISEDEIEATEKLLDRAADLFYHDIPEV